MSEKPVGNVEGKDTEGFRRLSQYLGLGTQLAAAVAGFGAMGYWIDWKFGTGQLWTTIMLFLGAFGGLYGFIRTVIRLGKETKEDVDRGKIS